MPPTAICHPELAEEPSRYPVKKRLFISAKNMQNKPNLLRFQPKNKGL
jgi:hypothetical protein